MPFIPHETITHLLQTYGVGLVGLLTAAECMGLPLPAEAALVIAAVYAGTTGKLSIYELVAIAAGAAILGQLAGYVIGRTAGAAALRRWGPRIGLTDDRLMLGRYLFRHHGAKVIILGRFVAFLRTLGALLAGANGMPWRAFLTADIIGAVLWASLYGFGAYVLGHQMETVARWAALVMLVAAVLAVIAVRRGERHLIEAARREETPA